MNSRRRSQLTAAILSIAVILALLLFYPRSRDTKPTAVAAPVTPTTKPLHVGLYLSEMTGEKWGVSCQIVTELSRGNFDLVPILEPGSETYEPVAKQLGYWFKGKTPIDATNAEALKKLDVIVAPRIWLIPQDALAAITVAVQSGTGLLARNGVGVMDPGSGPEVSQLSGFTESEFGYNAHPMQCEVLASHPLLGNLTVGKTIQVTPNGTWGIPSATMTPLIRVKDMNAFRDFYQGGSDDWTFYPLYTATLGKGKILGCQFPAWSAMPGDLVNATDNQFNIKAVRWLARSTNAPPTSHP